MLPGSLASNPSSRRLVDLVAGVLRRRDGPGQPGSGCRGDRVDPDPVPDELLLRDHGEGGDTALGGAVVALPDIAEQSRRRGRVDDRGVHRPAGLRLLAPVLGGGTGGEEVPSQVHPHDGVPLLVGHVDQHAVAEDAGVVHEHVQVAEGVDGRLHEPARPLPVGHVVAVGDRFPARGPDLRHDLLGRGRVAAGPVGAAAEVVDHDLCTLGREQQGVFPPHSASRAGDDGDATFQSTHGLLPFRLARRALSSSWLTPGRTEVGGPATGQPLVAPTFNRAATVPCICLADYASVR